jgi:two-component system response regulator
MDSRKFVELINVLLVEDNPGDVDLARMSLENSKLKVVLHVVADGEAAMAFLRKTGGFADAVRPDLVLLDLNLPRKDGREVLAEIKADEDLKRIPVVILTTSKADEDILNAYDLHANCYITKPIDLNQFIQVVKAIKEFWFTIVKLPTNGVRK